MGKIRGNSSENSEAMRAKVYAAGVEYDDVRVDAAIARARNLRRIKATMIGMASKQMTGTKGWYCLSVDVGRESEVQKALDKADVETSLPRRIGAPYRRRGRLVEGQSQPVMRGYVFVRYVLSDAATMGLKGVKHVQGLLGGAVGPRQIPDEDVNKFMTLAADGTFDHLQEVSRSMSVGHAVRVIVGPFASFPGVVTDVCEDQQFRMVAIVIFGRETIVEMHLAQLEEL